MSRTTKTLICMAMTSALLITGCAKDNPEPAATSSASSTSTGPSESASDQAEEQNEAQEEGQGQFSTDPQNQEAPYDERALPTAIELDDASEDVTKIYVSLDGKGTPGWIAEYVPEAHEQGRGEPLNPGGEAVLDVNITGVTLPESDADMDTVIKLPKEIELNTAQATKLLNDGIYEGNLHLVIGTNGQLPYRISYLPNKQAMLIEIKN